MAFGGRGKHGPTTATNWNYSWKPKGLAWWGYCMFFFFFPGLSRLLIFFFPFFSSFLNFLLFFFFAFFFFFVLSISKLDSKNPTCLIDELTLIIQDYLAFQQRKTRVLDSQRQETSLRQELNATLYKRKVEARVHTSCCPLHPLDTGSRGDKVAYTL